MAQQRNGGASARERFERRDSSPEKGGGKPWKREVIKNAGNVDGMLSLTAQVQAYFDRFVELNGSPFGVATNREIVEYCQMHGIDTKQIPAFQELLPGMIEQWESDNSDDE